MSHQYCFCFSLKLKRTNMDFIHVYNINTIRYTTRRDKKYSKYDTAHLVPLKKRVIVLKYRTLIEREKVKLIGSRNKKVKSHTWAPRS